MISEEHDVVVAGGGVAGAIAAIAAARNGADTLLIERYGFLGGSSTAAMVMPIQIFHTAKGIQVVRGIAHEVIDRLLKLGGCSGYKAWPSNAGAVANFTYVIQDVEMMKHVFLEMAEEANVRLLLHTLAVDVVLDGTKLRGLMVENKSGRQLILSKVTVDATGDGDIAARAGCQFEKGRTSDGLMQPATLVFRMGGVDIEKVNKWLEKDRDEGSFFEPKGLLKDFPTSGGLWFPPGGSLRKGEVVLNASRIHKVDGTNARDLTRAEIEGRKQVMAVVDFLRRRAPGFESSYLIETAVQVGLRETRRITGEYILTVDDVTIGRRFKDSIARNSYPVDIHNVNGKGVLIQAIQNEGYHDIPYRCIVPKGIDNLLIAGRCISATHEAISATRGMATCMALGQAAGTAAALALRHNVMPRQLDISLLQEKLKEQDAIL